MITLLLLSVPTAFATPLADKRAEADRIKTQVEELDEALEIAAEAYSEAQGEYEAVTAEVAVNEARVVELVANQQKLQGNLSTRVASMYRQGPLAELEVLFGATSFEEFATTWDILRTLNEQEAAQVAELKATTAELERVHVELAAQQAEAKAQADVMQGHKADAESQLAERSRLLSGVEAEITEILREQEAEERRRAEAAAAAARAAAASSSSSDYGTPTNAPRSSVVSIALSKLGAPYKWAASGPDMFDCSGFTSWVYRQVGVSLPRTSSAQIGAGQRVSRANLAPGDLVFFGSPIHHVGIYVGSGNYVHAPHTGDVVKVASLSGRSDYVGACRP
ncbi:MAG: NlpC/P60 family protein [Coriobacteriia bacterium]|nr:NlpC/P60 family protein [Coriobacteriia bacterium]